MKYEAKRRDDTDHVSLQEANRQWWSSNPMAYDWRGKNPHERFSLPWFDWIDEEFVQASWVYATDRQPFDRLIPFDAIRGKRVLEIGCGMGLHTELLTRAGGKVTAIDLSPTSIEATSRRLSVKDLDARVLQYDAEKLDRELGTFDFVWSWGVIHHSAHTGRIVRRVASVLTPEGRFKGMVYHRDGTEFWVALAKDWILRGNLFRHSVDEALWRVTDGFSARYYPVDLMRDLLLTFFEEVDMDVTGQAVDALPVPRRPRSLIESFVSQEWLRQRLSRAGTFLLFDARKPIQGP